MMKRIGLIAGEGELPRIWAREAGKRNYQVIAFPLLEEQTVELGKLTAETIPVNIGKLNQLLNRLQEQDINRLVILGKVNKTRLFRNLQLDRRMEDLLADLETLSDENILRALAAEFTAAGIEILKQSTFLEGLLAGEGSLTSTAPAADLREEMEFAFDMARKIGSLDIGQTVLVRDKAVLAVEAIEGTDRAIKRAGQLGGTGVVMAKVSRPGQDLRFDLPTVGLTTIKNLIEIEARALILEAGHTFIINRREAVRLAEEAGMVIMAME